MQRFHQFIARANKLVPFGKPGERRYANWAGNPKGIAEDLDCCVETVYGKGRFVPGQCSRKRGHGPNGEFCKQHAKALVMSPLLREGE